MPTIENPVDYEPPPRWDTVGRPGPFGKRRQEIEEGYDQVFGAGNWRLAWEAGPETVSAPIALVHFENSYVEFLDHHRGILRELVRDAVEIYDDAPTNVKSGRDYTKQETVRNHIHDVAIRNAIFRLGWDFEGERLIQIRDRYAKPPIHRLSRTLSPGRVPFYHPEWIGEIDVKDDPWWEPGTIEDWYQRNKVLQVRHE